MKLIIFHCKMVAQHKFTTSVEQSSRTLKFPHYIYTLNEFGKKPLEENLKISIKLYLSVYKQISVKEHNPNENILSFMNVKKKIPIKITLKKVTSKTLL